MSFIERNKKIGFRCRCSFCLMVLLCVLVASLANAEPAAGSESVQHFKMLSTIEYTGKGQFRNKAETLFTVNKHSLVDEKVQYLISATNPDLGQQQSFEKLSFLSFSEC